MKHLITLTLAGLALAGCGGGSVAPEQAMPAPRLAANLVVGTPATQETDLALPRFTAQAAAVMQTLGYTGSIYREGNAVAGGAMTLMVARLDPAGFDLNTQKARAEQMAQLLPGSHAQLVRAPQNPNNEQASTWAVVRDAASHCTPNAGKFAACSMPDTVFDAQKPDLKLKEWVNQIERIVRNVNPSAVAGMRIYRESHGFANGHDGSLVIRLETGALSRPEQFALAKSISDLLPNGAAGSVQYIRAPEFSSGTPAEIDAHRTEGVVLGVDYLP
ncbi:MAG TPA: hypothetical protein VIT92_15115 [Burkholderiaceae bacterium]